MMRKLMIVAALGGLAVPALAQIENERVLTIFGNDKCPENTICVRAPEAERFRIPKPFRQPSVIAPENESWAVRQRSADAASQAATGGAGSCSPVGAAGWTGCYLQELRAAKAEQKARTAAEPKLGN